MKDFFCDDNRFLSMKRLCGFICTIVLALTLVLSVLFEKSCNLSDTLIFTIGSLAFSCLGLTTIEKIFYKKNEV
jgi:hypothetical protein